MTIGVSSCSFFLRGLGFFPGNRFANAFYNGVSSFQLYRQASLLALLLSARAAALLGACLLLRRLGVRLFGCDVSLSLSPATGALAFRWLPPTLKIFTGLPSGGSTFLFPHFTFALISVSSRRSSHLLSITSSTASPVPLMRKTPVSL